MIFFGGHNIPISILGDRAIWKYAQNNEIKKKISEIMNKIIPIFRFLIILKVCIPWKVPSRTTSRHHWYKERITVNKEINIKSNFKK